MFSHTLDIILLVIALMGMIGMMTKPAPPQYPDQGTRVSSAAYLLALPPHKYANIPSYYVLSSASRVHTFR